MTDSAADTASATTSMSGKRKMVERWSAVANKPRASGTGCCSGLLVPLMVK
jgi:hypothetical protein